MLWAPVYLSLLNKSERGVQCCGSAVILLHNNSSLQKFNGWFGRLREQQVLKSLQECIPPKCTCLPWSVTSLNMGYCREGEEQDKWEIGRSKGCEGSFHVPCLFSSWFFELCGLTEEAAYWEVEKLLLFSIDANEMIIKSDIKLWIIHTVIIHPFLFYSWTELFEQKQDRVRNIYTVLTVKQNRTENTTF